jgi:SAM-dependent methyltransferase
MLYNFKQRLAGFIERSVRRGFESRFNLDYERRKIALRTTARFIESRLGAARRVSDKFELMRFALAAAPLEGLVLEFGVATGATIRALAETVPQRKLYGFDSFEGLPEDWAGYMPAGSFRQPTLPTVPNNVELVVGLFSDTLPRFLTETAGTVAFVHFDCDLYSSTQCVLENIHGRLARGAIFVFDEYYNYPGWKFGEHLALEEFVAKTEARIEYIGYTHSQQIAVRVIP